MTTQTSPSLIQEPLRDRINEIRSHLDDNRRASRLSGREFSMYDVVALDLQIVLKRVCQSYSVCVESDLDAMRRRQADDLIRFQAKQIEELDRERFQLERSFVEETLVPATKSKDDTDAALASILIGTTDLNEWIEEEANRRIAAEASGWGDPEDEAAGSQQLELVV